MPRLSAHPIMISVTPYITRSLLLSHNVVYLHLVTTIMPKCWVMTIISASNIICLSTKQRRKSMIKRQESSFPPTLLSTTFYPWKVAPLSRNSMLLTNQTITLFVSDVGDVSNTNTNKIPEQDCSYTPTSWLQQRLFQKRQWRLTCIILIYSKWSKN